MNTTNVNKRGNTEMEGVVTESLPNLRFRVILDEGQREVMAMIGGRVKKNCIRIMVGDRVRMEFTPYDPNLGRIIYRYR